MTQVYIGFSIQGVNGLSVAMRDNLFYAADVIGLDTTLCKHTVNTGFQAQCLGTDKGTVDATLDVTPETDNIHGTDLDIFKSDIMKLLAAKCAILELSNPSHEIGFCAGYLFSDRPKLPVLGLVSKGSGEDAKSSYKKRVSALIAGCPAISIREYVPERAREQLPQIIHDWLVTVGIFVPKPTSGPIILLVGPPGAGKTTQGRILSKHLGIPHISTCETLRALAATHPFYNELQKHHINGIQMPAPVMKHIIRERISQKNCRQGYILDGYPIDGDDALNLKELGVQPTLIIQIYADRETCIQRQLTRGERATDKDVVLATRRVDTYLAGFPSLLNSSNLGLAEEFKSWFPVCKRIGFDTTTKERTEDNVFNGILNLCNFAFNVPHVTQGAWESLGDWESLGACESLRDWESYFHPTRVHFHIYAADQQIVKDLAKKCGLPCKVYPIDTLIISGSKQIMDPFYAKTYAEIPYFTRDIHPNEK